MRSKAVSGYIVGAITLIMLVINQGCVAPLPTNSPSSSPENTPVPQTQIEMTDVLFRVKLPEPIVDGSRTVFLEILDEVTGLPYNPQRFKLFPAESGDYQAVIPLPLGSTIKYRYRLQAESLERELAPDGSTIRYRLAFTAPGLEVSDTVSNWKNGLNRPATGDIKGTITDNKTQLPIPNVIVSAAGIQTITSLTGNYWLPNVPIGIQNLVVMSMDGAYEVHQQGAMVAENAITPAILQLSPRNQVNVTWEVTPPPFTNVNQKLRLFGDLSQLGNSFADLKGNLSNSSLLSQDMALQTDGSYRLTLSMPVGAFINYKYSLGDGFWNSEHASEGSFVIRKILIPDHDIIIRDTVTTWQVSNYQPIHFLVRAPSSTPADDVLTIQFNPFVWMEPIPLWYRGNNEWEYMLYSPLNLPGKIQFRICRNGFCDSSSEPNSGQGSPQSYFAPSQQPQQILYQVNSWPNWDSQDAAAEITQYTVEARGNEYIYGISLDSYLPPSSAFNYTNQIARLTNLSPKTVMVSPTWQVTGAEHPQIAFNPAKNFSVRQVNDITESLTDTKTQVFYYPTLNFEGGSNKWWNQSLRDDQWWQIWFDQYRDFVLHFALLAEENNVDSLILGGSDLIPSLPNGKLFDGADALTPANAEELWSGLFADIRQIYHGKIGFAVTYPFLFDRLPSVASNVDFIFLEWEAPFLDPTDTSTDRIKENTAKYMDQDIKVLREDFGKPVYLGFSISSDLGCLNNPLECKSEEWMTSAHTSEYHCHKDLSLQSDIYEVVFSLINERSWVDGVFVRDYFSTVSLQDCSSSINGKPAQNTVWYWFDNWQKASP